MQHAIPCAAPVAGLKQHGMNGPPEAKLVPARTPPITVKIVVSPRSRVPHLLTVTSSSLCLSTDGTSAADACPDGAEMFRVSANAAASERSPGRRDQARTLSVSPCERR